MATIDKKEIRRPEPMAFHGCDSMQPELKTLLRALSWPSAEPESQLRTIGVTSCRAGEGVSTVAAQLAIAAAEMTPHRVLLADFNTADASVHRAFRVGASPGAAEVLAGNAELWSTIRTSGVANLSLLPAGNGAQRLRASSAPADLPTIVQSLRNEFDLVVFDLPAIFQADSDGRIATLLDGVILVVEAERTRWEVAKQGQQLLANARARVLGAVLNKRREPIPDWLYRLL